MGSHLTSYSTSKKLAPSDAHAWGQASPTPLQFADSAGRMGSEPTAATGQKTKVMSFGGIKSSPLELFKVLGFFELGFVNVAMSYGREVVLPIMEAVLPIPQKNEHASAVFNQGMAKLSQSARNNSSERSHTER